MLKSVSLWEFCRLDKKSSAYFLSWLEEKIENKSWKVSSILVVGHDLPTSEAPSTIEYSELALKVLWTKHDFNIKIKLALSID